MIGPLLSRAMVLRNLDAELDLHTYNPRHVFMVPEHEHIVLASLAARHDCMPGTAGRLVLMYEGMPVVREPLDTDDEEMIAKWRAY